MVNKTRFVIPGALSAALLAGLLAWFFLSNLESNYQEAGETGSVLVANQYIPRGTALRPGFFQILRIPKSYRTRRGDILRGFEIVSRAAPFRSMLALPQGTQLVHREMIPLEKVAALSQLIPDHHVAVSFGVNAVRGVGKSSTGDVIDVFRIPQGKGIHPTPGFAVLLFQAVPVIAVGKRWIPPGLAEAPNPDATYEGLSPQEEEIVLSVLLNPLAAARLVEARENDILSVVLRAPWDDSHWEKQR